jgi:D-arginine dehydrogenase
VHSCDVVVVGGGIAGVSVAYELAADQSVTLLEREPALATQSTGRSAAMFIDSYGGLEVRILAKASRRFLTEPPPEWDRPLLTPRGAVYVGFAGDEEHVVALHDELRPLNDQVRMLDTDGCVAAWPLLRPERHPTGVQDPLAQDMDVHALHTGYVRGLRARGGTVRTSAQVVDLSSGSAGWTARLADGSQLLAPVVVDAAGAWADRVGELAGAGPRGLQPMARSIFVVDRPDLPGASGWPLVQDVGQRFYCKPEGDGLLCSPSNETPVPPGDPRPDDLLIARAIDDLATDTLLDVTHVRHRWAGLRVFAPDRVPVVGFDPHRPGLFWLAGQGGYGIQTAPATARLAAALVRGQDVPADVADLGLDVAALGPDRAALGATRTTGTDAKETA